MSLGRFRAGCAGPSTAVQHRRARSAPPPRVETWQGASLRSEAVRATDERGLGPQGY